VNTSKNKNKKYGMKKLKTSGCLLLNVESINGSKNTIVKTIFNMVNTIKRLKMFFTPEENL